MKLSSDRTAHLELLISRPAREAATLSLVLLIILAAFGEIGIQTAEAGGWWPILLEGPQSVLPLRLLTILAWDILLWLILSACLGPAIERGRRGEFLLGFLLTLTLWRLVFRATATLFNPNGFVPPPVGVHSLLVIWTVIILLGIGKLELAQYCGLADRSWEAPVLGALAWHHRKDAVFTFLMGLALSWGWWGGSVAQADQVLSLVKIGLLGNAAFGLSRRCLQHLGSG